MGLFDFLFGEKKSTESLKVTKSKSDLLDEYEYLKKETEKLQAENKAWEIEFNQTVSSRQKAQKLEKENKLDEALSVYLQSIERDESSKKLIIYNFAYDIDRVIVLYGKTKQKEKLNTFLEEKINNYQDFRGVQDWMVRLSKLNEEKQTKTLPFNPSDIEFQKPRNPTLGKQIDDFKKNMPEFNFYFDMPEGSDTLGYSNKVPFELSKKLGEYREAFKMIKSRAKIAENGGDYKTAIEAYEKLIIEEYDDPEPYERLIIIYSKLKWKEEEKSILERAILFFTKLKERQLEYVENLAKKYGMVDKAKEYISQDKKIFYYLGAFELYNPQATRLKKWSERLRKLNEK
jgi:tetratricopeptide (TPR) repeat protein